MSTLTFQRGRFVFREGLEQTPLTLREATARHTAAYVTPGARRVLSRLLFRPYSFTGKLPSVLDPHQIDGVRWVLTRARSYLAHAPGSGKTLEAFLASALGKGNGQVVFIVPPTATVNWEREAMHWGRYWARARGSFPTVGVLGISTQRGNMDWNAEVLIIPDSMLAKPWVLAELHSRKIRFLAVDEASRFKDPTAQRTLALFGGELKSGQKTAGLTRLPRYVTLLDGSPFTNRAMEMWAPAFAMAPYAIDFMGQEEFGHAYCGATISKFGQWEFKYSSNEKQLRRKLTRDFMHVVGENVLSHPERRRRLVFTSSDARGARQRKWERKNIGQLERVEGEPKSTQGEMATFRRELGLKKVKWVSEYVNDLLQRRDESILLFAWHRSVIMALEKSLKQWSPGIVMGGTASGNREACFRKFQNGHTKLLILNIASGGRIHNLQRADRVVFAEWSWSPETNLQAEKRAARKGRTSMVKCDYVVAPGSMDEVVLRSVFRKDEMIRRLMR